MIKLTNNQRVQIQGKLSFLQDARVFTLRGYYQDEGIPIPADWDAVVKREKQIGGNEFTFTLMGSMLSNNPEYYEREQAERALAPVLATGDVVEVEGKQFKITNTGNNNFGLEEVK
jgi:hypothetical protein